MSLDLDLLKKFLPPEEEADAKSADILLPKVRSNIEHLKAAVLAEAKLDTIKVLDNIHNQLLDCPEITYLLTDNEVETVISAYINGSKESITSEKAAKASAKSEEKERKARLKEFEKVNIDNVDVNDY